MDPQNPLAVCSQFTVQQLSQMFVSADNVHARSRGEFQKATHALANVPTEAQTQAYMKQMSDMIQIGQQADAIFAMTQVCQRVKEGLQIPNAKLPSLRGGK